MDIKELDKIEEPPKTVRRGGKQKSGKAPLKHSNFYIQINTMTVGDNIGDEKLNELKQVYRKIIADLSVEIENRLLSISGNANDEKKFNIKKADSKNELWLRLEANPKITYFLEIGEQSGMIYLHFLYSVSKRGLDTSIDLSALKDYINGLEGLKAATISMSVYRDAKADINVYVNKNKIV